MSGICALAWLDGRSATRQDLLPLLTALAHRGPDGSEEMVQGAVALGFARLASTPEAATEILPLRHEPSGCVIVADARLDNRDELAAALGLEARGKGDGELILHAYFRWGDEAALRLLGDFAFVIWDERRRRLLAVRDPFGMRQLHVAHLPGRLLALATDERALVAHPDIPTRVNEVRIADFLHDLEGADLTSTFYRDVERLPPAHLLVLEEGRVERRRYLALEPMPPLRLQGDEEYAEAFLEVFGQAVKARLRGGRAVGAMLSGGLDSSAIVAVASRLADTRPLAVFSAVSDAQACPETVMIRRVQALANLNPVEVRPEAAATFASDRLPALTCNPFDGDMLLVACVYRAAAKAGCNVLLDGALGDVVLDQRNIAARLLRRGKMVQAWRHARDERDFWGRGPGAAALMLDHARAAFLPDWSRALKRRTRLLAGRTMPADKLMCPTFARRIDIAGRKHLLAERAPSPKQAYASDRLAAILHPNVVVGRERYDRVASVFGLEARDPFLDLRLVRFALSLPPEQLVRGGSTKFVLRKAMAGLLPDDVRWRRGKDHLGRTFIAAALTTRAEDRSHMIDRQRSSLEKWIKPARVEEARARDAVLDDPSLQAVGHLASWLESSFQDKVLPSPGVATKKPAARTMCSEGRPNE